LLNFQKLTIKIKLIVATTNYIQLLITRKFTHLHMSKGLETADVAHLNGDLE